MPAGAEARSIGQVLAALKGDFPDISISKIRFLESEGLVAPLRAPSGYRRYAQTDIERLRYVLTVQRDHYLPLKVIREHLDQMDRGQPAPARTTTPSPTASAGEAATSTTAAAPSAGRPAVAPSPSPNAPRVGSSASRPQLRLTRQELLEASGLSDSTLAELERNHIVVPRRGTTTFGREALTLSIAARRLAEFGVEGRHLRAFKMSADREVGLVEQAIAPYVRRAGGSRDVSGEVTQLVVSFHAALIRSAMEP